MKYIRRNQLMVPQEFVDHERDHKLASLEQRVTDLEAELANRKIQVFGQRFSDWLFSDQVFVK